MHHFNISLWCFLYFQLYVFLFSCIFLVFPIICFPVCLFEFVVRLSKLLQSLLFEFLRPDWPSNRQANQTYFLWIIFFTYFSDFHVLIHICMFCISDLYILDDHICMIRMYAIISKLEESGQLHPLLACGSFFQPIWCALHVESRHLS